MRSRAHFGWSLAVILAAALLLRLAAGAWWQQRLPQGKRFGFGDSESYWQLGRAIARGQAFEYGPDRLQIFRTPGYPVVLAPLFLARDEPPVFWGRAVSAVLSTLAVGSVAWLARILLDRPAALVAAAIAAAYPEAIALGAFVLSEAPFAPLMVLNLVFWTMAWRAGSKQDRAGWALAAGAAAGLATLMRPSWLLFVPFAGLVGAIVIGGLRRATQSASDGGLGRHLAITGLACVGLCLTMLPWWIRNYRVANRFVPTTLQVGASLYDGLNPTATGASDMRFVGAFVAEQRAADAHGGAHHTGLFEDRLDQRMRSAAIDWAQRHPANVLKLAIKKFARMWCFVPNASEFQSSQLRLILAATYTPILLLALGGVWRLAPRDWPFLLCCLPAVYLTCLHVVFVSSIRYRGPAMLPLIVLAASLVASFKAQVSRNENDPAAEPRNRNLNTKH